MGKFLIELLKFVGFLAGALLVSCLIFGTDPTFAFLLHLKHGALRLVHN